MSFLLIPVILAASAHASGSCIDRRMDCYLDVYSVCSSALKGDTSCQKKLLASCDRDFRCPGDALSPEKPLSPGYKINPRIQYSDNCAPFKARIDAEVGKAISRFQDCLNYAFVKEDLAKRMIGTLEAA